MHAILHIKVTATENRMDDKNCFTSPTVCLNTHTKPCNKNAFIHSHSTGLPRFVLLKHISAFVCIPMGSHPLGSTAAVRGKNASSVATTQRIYQTGDTNALCVFIFPDNNSRDCLLLDQKL